MGGSAIDIVIGTAEDEFARREGAYRIVSMIDEMRNRPPQRHGDLPLPTVAVHGQSAAVAEATIALRQRRNHPPHAYIAVPPLREGQPGYSFVADLLRQAATQLASTAPRGDARIRFLLLDYLIPLIDQPLPGPGTRPSDSAKAALRGRGGPLPRPAAGQTPESFWHNLRALADGPIAASVLVVTAFNLFVGFTLVPALVSISVSLVLAGLAAAARARNWSGSLRLRWFRRQPFSWQDMGRIAYRPASAAYFVEKLFELRHRVASTSPPAAGITAAERQQAGDELELLLVHAFLEDLRQAYQRRWWRIWRPVTWARTVYPLLLLSGDCGALTRRFEQVRVHTATPDPLLLVAMLPESLAWDVPDLVPQDVRVPVRPEDVDKVWRGWQTALARDRRIGSRRVLAIVIDRGHSQWLLKGTPDPPPPRRKPVLSRSSVIVPLLLVMLVAPPSYMVAVTHGRCEGALAQVATGECIGIGDGGFAFHPRLRSLSAYIHDSNRRIEASRSPYATLIFLGALSAPKNAADDQGDLIADAQGELAGVALAQRRLIQNSKDTSLLQIRILPVNAGSKYRYAGRAAQAVLDRINQERKEDRAIIGVVGLNESHRPVQEAIERLSQRAVPIITTASTFDDLGKVGGMYLPSVFPLAAPNSVLARQAAQWARIGVAGRLTPMRSAVVFADDTVTDLYARDLGEKFKNAFGSGARMQYFTGADTLKQAVNQICRATAPPDLLFYAGRSDQFGEFRDAVAATCHDKTVMAGDAVTQFANDRAAEVANDGRIRFVYTPLAAESSWSRVPSVHRTPFYDNLRTLVQDLRLNDEPLSRRPSPAYAALAYDAADALVQAAQEVYRAQRAGGADADTPAPAGIPLALERLGPINGASGLVKLHGASNRQHPLDRPILLATVEPAPEGGGARHVVIAQCGRLYLGQAIDRGCASDPAAPG